MFSSTGQSGNGWSNNSSWTGNSGGFSQAAFNGSSTFGVINELKFAAAKSSRQSTIILSAFNIVSAAATAAGILYNNYLSAKRSPRKRKERVDIFSCIRSPDVYPFILSLGIVGQGVIFVVAQSEGLDSLFRPGCALISQFTWPGIFIVPYIQLVFAVETTLRALKSSPFPPRSKWTVAICITIVTIALLATGLSAFFIHPPNFCFAALFWFVAKWAQGGFALLIGIVLVLMVCGVMIYVNLTRHSVTEDDERVSASRMIYYIVLAIIPNALMIPFFGYLSFGNPFENGGDTGLTLSMVSTVVANVTGLMTGGLYLFLRSSTSSSIGPKDKLDEHEHQQMKYQGQMPYNNDSEFNSHIQKPIRPSHSLHKAESQERRSMLPHIAPLRTQDSTRFDNAKHSNPSGSNTVLRQSSIAGNSDNTPLRMIQIRKPSLSYALFPSETQGSRVPESLLPSGTHSRNTSERSNDYGDTLRPPPSVQLPGFRHRRDSSLASSATVQIGLRLSNFDDAQPMTVNTVGGVERTHELGCPKKLRPGVTSRPSPLIALDNVASSRGPRRPPGTDRVDLSTKKLPPVPQDSRTETMRPPILNPTVYSPNSSPKGKIPSPRGVGFSIPDGATTAEIIQASAAASRIRANSATESIHRTDWI
ncbi:hypothetical protein F4777DRAFT_67538 [Nemania sp. FL0916]|nr:hypothetical protein F4777DRAFT_67538 [Nemania sp. FL0916]